ncbi:MAG: DUF2292 domain-containing protein [Deltaproteobacteria bacterium]|nr:DUF2292 domain-containing protein [Deltaproteobacteria bacterium]
MSEQLTKVIEILKKLTSIKFYGSILIKFENGKVVHIKKEENIKIE